MPNKYRAVAEVEAEIGTLMAEADKLKEKASTEEGLTPEEQARLEEIVSQLESLQSEETQARTQERLAAVKVRREEPVRPAPKLPATYRRTDSRPSVGESLALYMRSFTADADLSADAAYKARTHGFQLGNPNARIDCSYEGLNFKTRTLSKGGTGLGAELQYKTYSDKVVEYLTYFSPVLGVLDSETTADGQTRTYFRTDDTALESAYITASSGTETNPTIPDKDIATGSVDIATFTITSGFQKVSYQALRDSAANLEDKIAKANGHSHARKFEREIITATGNGTTGVQGLMQVDNALTPVATLDQDALESLYFSIPPQYRQNAVFLYNDATAAQLRTNLKDTTGRSLFDRNIVDGVEWDTLLGKRAYISQYMPANTVLFFTPEFYKLRMVSGQVFQVFRERFAPHVAWMGLADFGGAWLGPTGANGAVHSITTA